MRLKTACLSTSLSSCVFKCSFFPPSPERQDESFCWLKTSLITSCLFWQAVKDWFWGSTLSSFFESLTSTLLLSDQACAVHASPGSSVCLLTIIRIVSTENGLCVLCCPCINSRLYLATLTFCNSTWNRSLVPQGVGREPTVSDIRVQNGAKKKKSTATSWTAKS